MNDTIRKLLETPYWPPTLYPNTEYRRQHDDHDGSPKGGLMVMFDKMGDAYLSADRSPWLRFRTYGGGGRSERTRAALLVLAEAIRLDNDDNPQTVEEAPREDRKPCDNEDACRLFREWMSAVSVPNDPPELSSNEEGVLTLTDDAMLQLMERTTKFITRHEPCKSQSKT